MRRMCPVIVFVAALSASAQGQSFNVEFGPPGSAPSPAHRAAGLPGVWNEFGVMPTSVRFPLTDIHGNSGGPARIYNIGSSGVMAHDHPGTTGDDGALMDDAITSQNNPVDACIFFEGLVNGEYEVILYGMTPGQPAHQNRLYVDNAQPGPTWVGGAWPGAHVEGVTFQRFTTTVFDGRLGTHSGVFSGNFLSVINAVQVRRIVDCPADTNADFVVDFTDLNDLLSQYGQTGAGLGGDLDDDGDVDFADLNALLGSYGVVCG